MYQTQLGYQTLRRPFWFHSLLTAQPSLKFGLSEKASFLFYDRTVTGQRPMRVKEANPRVLK